MPLSRAYRPLAGDMAKIPIVTAIHSASVRQVLQRNVARRLVPHVKALLNKPFLGLPIRPLPHMCKRREWSFRQLRPG